MQKVQRNGKAKRREVVKTSIPLFCGKCGAHPDAHTGEFLPCPDNDWTREYRYRLEERLAILADGKENHPGHRKMAEMLALNDCAAIWEKELDL